MSTHIQFGKRPDPSAASAAARRGVTANSSLSGSSAVSSTSKSRVLIVLAFIAALVPGYFVWSWAGIEAVARLLGDRSADWSTLSLDKVLQMANNAQSQFAEVNSILGIPSGDKNPQSQFAGVNRLAEILSVDWSKLSPVEKEQMVKDANTQTAVVFKRWLPMAAISGMTLFAIDPAGRTLRYSYRINPSQNGSDTNQAGQQLRRQVCGQTITRKVMRHGGHYEFVLYDSDDHIIDQFTISESSCS